MTRYGNNPHPARGRKLTPLRANADQNRKQPTPRKGTETVLKRYTFTRRNGNNPHPARGRKLSRIAADKFITIEETTHTPQGDGKPFVFTLQKLLEKPFTSPTGDN